MARQGTSPGAILTGAGSLFAALAASACCWMPLLLLGLGVSATAVGSVTSVLEAYRPAFIGVGVALLGTAWYFIYFRKGPKASSGKEDCCAAPSVSSATTQIACSCCGQPGKRVPSRTVRALLREDLRSAVAEGNYVLCLNPACAQVYTGPGGTRAFVQSDLAIRVGFKEKDPPHLVCYCFGHSVEGIEEEMLRTDGTTVVERIRAEVQAGRCACSTKNPQGTCCLGNVARAVKEAQDRLAGLATAPVGAPAVQCAPPPLPGESHEACCRLPGDGAPASVGRIQRLNRTLLPVFTVMILGFLAFPDRILGWVTSRAAKPQPRAISNPVSLPEPSRRAVTLRVPGMT